MKKLYIVDQKGQLREWSVEPDEEGFIIRHGVYGGAIQEKFEHVPRGKVNRDVFEQIELQMNSRINKQKDRGYVDTVEEAISKKATNAIGLSKPMLAQTYSKVEVNYNEPVYVQRKYDGNRCIICKQNDKVIAYSRNGKPVHTIDHITSNIRLGEGQAIDGELYVHGATLQEIVSFVKRQQEDSLRLQFHAYDLISDKPFQERYAMLHDIPGVSPVETIQVHKEEDILDLHAKFRHEKFEGTIIRHTSAGYEDGKRSKSLLKLKDWQDEEFLVTNIYPSKDGWAVLECIQPNGSYFSVTAPGNMAEKQEVFACKSNYIGKCVTVEFAYRTAEGIPFHPVAKAWR